MARKPTTFDPDALGSYTCKTPIEHDQKAYEVGDPIELTWGQAKPLLDVKAIEDPNQADAAADTE